MNDPTRVPDAPDASESAANDGSDAPAQRLVDVVLDETTIARADPDVEHERAVAIYDLLAQNTFRPIGHEPHDEAAAAYALHLGILDRRLVFDVHAAGERVCTHMLSLVPLRRVVRDYFLICESYYDAIRTSSSSQIEAIDMARRGLHNEGSETLQERLDGKIEVDFDTARRLFTLVCALDFAGDPGAGGGGPGGGRSGGGAGGGLDP